MFSRILKISFGRLLAQSKCSTFVLLKTFGVISQCRVQEKCMNLPIPNSGICLPVVVPGKLLVMCSYFLLQHAAEFVVESLFSDTRPFL